TPIGSSRLLPSAHSRVLHQAYPSALLWCTESSAKRDATAPLPQPVALLWTTTSANPGDHSAMHRAARATSIARQTSTLRHTCVATPTDRPCRTTVTACLRENSVAVVHHRQVRDAKSPEWRSPPENWLSPLPAGPTLPTLVPSGPARSRSPHDCKVRPRVSLNAGSLRASRHTFLALHTSLRDC